MNKQIEEGSISEDLNLISLVKNGDNDAIKTLISKHSGICVNTYKKYINRSGIGSFVADEIASSKDYIIYNSAKSYDPTMGSKFSTWLANQTRFFCLNCINKNNNIIPTDNETLASMVEIAQPLLTKKSEKEKELNHEILDLIKSTLSELSNKNIKESIRLKYFSTDDKCKTFTEIASEMGVTVQTVINWHKKFIKLVKQKCKNRKILFDL